MKSRVTVTGESADHKLAAIFSSETEAHRAVEALSRKTGLDDAQIKLVSPGDTHQARQIEPESGGIWRTMIRAHIWLGVAGAIAGAILFFALYILGIEFIRQSAVTAGILLTVIGGVIGLMGGGLVTLRPDHARYAQAAQSALEKGEHVLTVHAHSSDELNTVIAELEHHHARIVRTL
ncbi:hypothetical protein [Marinobacter halophilus]|uniref:Riboflavin biosynthesis protein RibA n=1 Tax=Marinobacter halophilus TaxID=1323740 RepID=A0A2T1K991_9GAMM|nr:hypothetical protein [Marinobacter halophilus]PSF06695.1 hypothetical protein C7H08_16560 [Marinobacter halophilus]GGC74773.1 hypothetical protein GCM10011362_24180 [Marinobacter halophilus]